MARPPPPGLTWAFPDVPVPGEPRAVAPGVYWLRMPLPFELDHINLWLLDADDGWTLVDTGAAAGVTRACWEECLGRNRLGKPLRRILVTHFHPDHVGLAGPLSARTGAEVRMSDLTWRQSRELLAPEMSPDAAPIRDFCERHEAAHPAEFGYFCTGGMYRDVVDCLPVDYMPLQDGEGLRIGTRHWDVMLLGGHAEGHAVLRCPELGLLIAGDQVLPTITSNVSKFLDEGNAQDPLGNYLASFARLDPLPEDVLVLPSHGRVFRGLQVRISQLRGHHEKTLAQVRSLCATPRTTGSLVRDLFPRATAGLNYMLAFGETRAHVVYLANRGELAEETASGRNLYHAP